VLAEAAYQCANPRCTHVLTLQLHHMIWVKDGGANEPSNLVALCGWHHDLHTQGHIPAEAIRMWKGMLLALDHAFDRESMDLLLFLYRQRRRVIQTRNNYTLDVFNGDTCTIQTLEPEWISVMDGWWTTVRPTCSMWTTPTA